MFFSITPQMNGFLFLRALHRQFDLSFPIATLMETKR